MKTISTALGAAALALAVVSAASPAFALGGCGYNGHRNYWGRYWGRLYFRPGVTSESPECGNLRAVLAFTAINWILFMFSTVIVRPILPQVVTCDINRKTGNLPICKRTSVREYLRFSQ